MKKKKVPLIVFSGGVDSTYLLYKELQRGDVDIVSLESDNFHPVQQKAEIAARNNILSRLKEFFPDRVIRHSVFSMGYISRNNYVFISNRSGTDYIDDYQRTAFAQIPFFLTTIMYTLCPNRHSSIKIGFINGDDGVMAIKAFKKTYKEMFDLFYHTAVSKYSPRFKRPKLKFPLTSIIKGIIFEEAEKDPYLKELISMAHYCEKPIHDNETDTYHVCKFCPSCLRMIDSEIHQSRIQQANAYAERKDQQVETTIGNDVIVVSPKTKPRAKKRKSTDGKEKTVA